MKRETIEKALEGLNIEDKELLKSTVDSLMGEYGKAFKEKEEEISTLKTTNETLETNLKETNDKVKELSKVDTNELEAKIKELNEKYDNDTKALNDKISQQAYDFKLEELTSKINFSSKGAKNDFLSQIKNKNLKLEDGKIMGFDDFVESYKQNDSGAIIEKKEEGSRPVVVNSGSNHDGVNPKQSYTLLEALKEQYGK